MEEFNLKFPAEELDSRREILAANLEKIRAHNSAGTSSFRMGVNQYAAFTAEEFKNSVVQGYNKFALRSSDDDEAESSSSLSSLPVADLSAHVPTDQLPPSVDWRTKGVVTPPKNQGGCGSCWAFSATETVESNVAINTGTLLELAPQEYVSCAPNPDHCGGTGGCQGSTQWLAFNYSTTKGLALEKTYPYYGSDTKCRPEKETPAVTITGYERLPQNNYTALMNAVVNVGPIAISAAAEPWQLYESGIFDDNCGADVDHAIQLVGYGAYTSDLVGPTTQAADFAGHAVSARLFFGADHLLSICCSLVSLQAPLAARTTGLCATAGVHRGGA